MQGGRPAGLTLFVRTARPATDVVSALRDRVRTIDPALPLFEAGGLEEAVDSSFDNRRAVMLLLAAFAGLALFLSALGIYGVLAYDVRAARGRSAKPPPWESAALAKQVQSDVYESGSTSAGVTWEQS